jgi:hypothetical protein
VEQLKKIGTVVSTACQKERVDQFAGEARNPLAPETPGRRKTKKVSPILTTALFHNTHHYAVLSALKSSTAGLDNRTGIQLVSTHSPEATSLMIRSHRLPIG